MDKIIEEINKVMTRLVGNKNCKIYHILPP
jgi:hypothetical protein